MTTLIHSLTKILLALTLAVPAFAQEQTCSKDFEVVDLVVQKRLFGLMKSKGHYEWQTRTLTELKCNNTFESEYFKIVKSTGSEAISFDDEDKELIKKAANVYFHLTRAHNFWVNEMKSEYIKNMDQIVVRVDIVNKWSSTAHFVNENQAQNYNEAWTIRPGKTPKSSPIQDKWGREIWFAPKKVLLNRERVAQSEGNNPVHESLKLVQDPIMTTNQNSIIYAGLGFLAAPNWNNTTLFQTVLKKIGTIAGVYLLVEGTKYMDKMFMEKYYYMETALVPEVIYHEYSHVALSDHLETGHSVPVIEGLADYFASLISLNRKMYRDIDDISKNVYKDISNKKRYSVFYEADFNATSDYTLGLLWKGRMLMDKANKERMEHGRAALVNYDSLVYFAHTKLNNYSPIFGGASPDLVEIDQHGYGLTQALMDSCVIMCDNQRLGMGVLSQAFNEKGLH